MIPVFNANDLATIKQQLSSPRKIAIVTHYKPDGDAMGSSLALYDFLKNLQHDVMVVAPSDYPDFLRWMPGDETVINYEFNPAQAEKVLSNAEIIFMLDFNDERRVEKMEAVLRATKAFKIMIDHHLEPSGFCDITLSFAGASSTCELIYHFAKAIDTSYKLTLAFAENVYVGIMTDTGSFRFSSTSGDVHRIMADLLDAGVIPNKIHEAVYDNFSANRTHFLGFCLKDKLTVLNDYNVAYIVVSKKELYQYKHQTGDTEGIVNYALGIKGMRMAAFLCEHENMIKISFRSKGEFSVKELAAQHFSGGGHQNAAGGKSLIPLDETISKFLALLP
ncbi:MAG: DHH family phosphoesterase, partial [Bacteroidia bacterium]